MKSKVEMAFSFAILSVILMFLCFVYLCIYIKQASIILKVEDIFIAKMSVKKCIIWEALRSSASNLCTKICQASEHYKHDESHAPKLQRVVLTADRNVMMRKQDKNSIQIEVSMRW